MSDWPAFLDVMDIRRRREGHRPSRRPQGQKADVAPVYARMNYGRWLADCECKAAVLLFRGKPGEWFWCPACENAATAGQLRPVIWPDGRDQIDADKSTLPAALANWDPADDRKRGTEPPPPPPEQSRHI